jgi:two-component system copper resistance phosphate regulon response regulator CusR
MRVLLVEDDAGIATMIRRGLEDERYQVDIARDGARGLELARSGEYGIIVLDLMLPKMDGWQVCENLRAAKNQTPILMLTARDSVDDRVKGLDTGADDYLPKPFDFKELLARLRALARRERIHRARLIQIADLEIDTVGRRVTRHGVEIRLSHREFELLEALASNEGRVLDRQTIQERVWLNEEVYSNMVDVYIGTLRKKIDSGQDVKLIHTVHGVGDSLRTPDSPRAEP